MPTFATCKQGTKHKSLSFLYLLCDILSPSLNNKLYTYFGFLSSPSRKCLFLVAFYYDYPSRKPIYSWF